MILGELVPKNFALALPLQTARLVVPLQVGFTTVFKPAVALLNGTANAVLRAMGIETAGGALRRTKRRGAHLAARRSASEGSLEQDTATLLERTLSFSELSASDVMTPRPRLSTIRVSDSARPSSTSPAAPASAASPSSRRTRTTWSGSCTSSRPSRSRVRSAPRCRSVP